LRSAPSPATSIACARERPASAGRSACLRFGGDRRHKERHAPDTDRVFVYAEEARGERLDARGQRLDARTDVYALGSVLYEVLTG
jgi:hypothetical protein